MKLPILLLALLAALNSPAAADFSQLDRIGAEIRALDRAIAAAERAEIENSQMVMFGSLFLAACLIPWFVALLRRSRRQWIILALCLFSIVVIFIVSTAVAPVRQAYPNAPFYAWGSLWCLNVVFACASARRPKTKPCRFCQEPMQTAATVCPHCQREQSVVPRTAAPQPKVVRRGP